jgi:hypothetical protein
MFPLESFNTAVKPTLSPTTGVALDGVSVMVATGLCGDTFTTSISAESCNAPLEATIQARPTPRPRTVARDSESAVNPESAAPPRPPCHG